MRQVHIMWGPVLGWALPLAGCLEDSRGSSWLGGRWGSSWLVISAVAQRGADWPIVPFFFDLFYNLILIFLKGIYFHDGKRQWYYRAFMKTAIPDLTSPHPRVVPLLPPTLPQRQTSFAFYAIDSYVCISFLLLLRQNSNRHGSWKNRMRNPWFHHLPSTIIISWPDFFHFSLSPLPDESSHL